MNNIVAEFRIHYHQYLDPEGQANQPLPAFAQDKKELISLYRLLTLLRTFDNKAVVLQRTGRIGTYAGILGQEAISTAIGSAMKPEDALCPAYREYGAMIQRGVKLSDILAFWGGDERGSAFNNPQDFPICVPIGTQCLHGAGIATAFKIRNQPRVAVVVLGDGGTSQGDFYEAMNVAGAWQLPLVFVINNNQWAISVSRNAQTASKTLAQKAIAAGIDTMQVDGNDILVLKDKITHAIEKARHTTADDAKRYRDDQEVEVAWSKEPLIRFKKYLLTQKFLTEEEGLKIQAECTDEVETAVQEYLSLKAPDSASMFDYHYAKLPNDLAEQRREFLLMEEQV
jgi:2-oxoisovalerate dehydrogenase E1 component alpha subunit